MRNCADCGLSLVDPKPPQKLCDSCRKRRKSERAKAAWAARDPETKREIQRQTRLRMRRCSVEDCERPGSYANGLCAMHNKRLRTHGTLESGVRGFGYTKHGYKYLHMDGRQVLEHRHVMEQKIGRRLLPSESVHHINGVRDDNRPENLELWSSSQPKGQRVEDKVAWAVELLRLYAPGRLT